MSRWGRHAGRGGRNHAAKSVVVVAGDPPGAPFWWFDFNDLSTLWHDDERTGVTSQAEPVSYVDNKGSDTVDVVGAAETGDHTGESMEYNEDSFTADELGWGYVNTGDGTVTLSGTFPGAANNLTSHSGMVVFAAESFAAEETMLLHADAGKSGRFEIDIGANGDAIAVKCGEDAAVGAEIPIDTACAVAWHTTTGVGDMYLSWTATTDEFAPSTGVTLAADTGMKIGMAGDASDKNLLGWIGEALLYTSDIGITGINDLKTYATAKWGVTWT